MDKELVFCHSVCPVFTPGLTCLHQWILLRSASWDWSPDSESSHRKAQALLLNLWPTSQDRLRPIGSLMARLTYNLLHSHRRLSGQRFPWEQALGSSNLLFCSPHSSGGRLDSFLSGPYSSALFPQRALSLPLSLSLALVLSHLMLWNSSDRSAVGSLWTWQQWS